jgi:hypothetical protein
VQIREYIDTDWPSVWPIFREIVAAGETFAYDPKWTSEQAREVDPPGLTAVACDGSSVLGTAHMGPTVPVRAHDHNKGRRGSLESTRPKAYCNRTATRLIQASTQWTNPRRQALKNLQIGRFGGHNRTGWNERIATGNRVGSLKPSRGFESHPLRFFPLLERHASD